MLKPISRVVRENWLNISDMSDVEYVTDGRGGEGREGGGGEGGLLRDESRNGVDG